VLLLKPAAGVRHSRSLPSRAPPRWPNSRQCKRFRR
jgi:hypothetical protein